MSSINEDYELPREDVVFTDCCNIYETVTSSVECPYCDAVVCRDCLHVCNNNKGE